MRNPYDVLGVTRQADEAAIKKAFRKLAKLHHPDRNAGDAKAKDKFAEVNSAYEVLGDPAKRAQFDRGEIDAEGKPRFQGFEGFGGGGAQGFEGFGFGGGGGGARPAGTEDIFSHIFGDALRSGRTRGPRRGDDITAIMTVTVEEVARGEKQRIALPSGREIEVTLPPGVSEGQTIRLRGLGNPGQAGAEPGDVLLTIQIVPQDRYVIEGTDLRVRIPVDLADAVLGGKVRVQTPTGAVDMSIPPMTSSGRTFRLRGRGLPGKAGPGDLFVAVDIRLAEGRDEELEAYAKARRARAG